MCPLSRVSFRICMEMRIIEAVYASVESLRGSVIRISTPRGLTLYK